MALDRVSDLTRDFDRILDLSDLLRIHNSLGPWTVLRRSSDKGLPASAISRRFGRILARALALDLERVSNLERAVDLARARAHYQDDAPGKSDDHDLGREHDDALAHAMGYALSKAIGEALRAVEGPDEWAARFASAFAEATGAGDDWAFTTDPRILRRTLDLAVTMLLSILPGADPAGEQPWARTVALSLMGNARPVFGGLERPSGDKPAAIRLPALCLAGEADALGRVDIGDLFRQVAAGITVLEMAEAGENPSIDVIMLAVD